jgi:hypothetical protein
VLSPAKLEPLPAAWFITGSRSADYEVGLLPGTISQKGNRVVQLRLRSAVSEPDGFGTLIQGITATRYRGRRVRFSATVRAQEVVGCAGLWLRIDGPRRVLMIDNMQDRPLRQTTAWTRADIVLDVPEEASELHFGALLNGAGAIDLTQPEFEETSEAVPVMTRPLPDEPQALHFGIAS